MKVIYKYPLEFLDKQVIEMPAVFNILSIDVQNNQPCIWAVVDPLSLMVNVTFYMLATGQTFEVYPGEYIGTVITDNGYYVFHVFKEYA